MLNPAAIIDIEEKFEEGNQTTLTSADIVEIEEESEEGNDTTLTSESVEAKLLAENEETTLVPGVTTRWVSYLVQTQTSRWSLCITVAAMVGIFLLFWSETFSDFTNYWQESFTHLYPMNGTSDNSNTRSVSFHFILFQNCHS